MMLDQYLSAALKQLRERLVELKSGRPRRLPAEFDLASQSVAQEVDRLVAEVEELQNEQESGRIVAGTVIDEYRVLVNEAARLESVVIPSLSNVDERDIALTRLLRAMHAEINFPLWCPAVTCSSQELFWIDGGFHLLGVPFREDHSPIQVPVFYHELAHLLFEESNDSQVAAFQHGIVTIGAAVTDHFRNQEIRISRQRVSELIKARLKVWRVLWIRNWLEELCCDAYAAIVGGPAYAWAFMHGAVAFGADPFELPGGNGDCDHPADDARAFVIFTALKQIGCTMAAESLEAFWSAAKTGMGREKEEEFQHCYPRQLLEAVVRQMVAASCAAKCHKFRNGENGTVRSELLRYWETTLAGGEIDAAWLTELGNLGAREGRPASFGPKAQSTV